MIAGVVIGGIIGAGVMLFLLKSKQHVVSPIIESIARPLDSYTILNLSAMSFEPSQIKLEEQTATTASYTVWRFSYAVDDPRSGKPDAFLRVTGLAHIPTSDRPIHGFPVIAQLRGYADRAAYFSGQGTRHSAEVFAAHGYMSLAPDFLGYGGSSKPGADIFEERFQTYTTVLTLLASIRTLPMADASRVGIWGHSNGGQIALTVLEASKNAYPALLWAPVSKPFPYSILYYTDEADDYGMSLRKKLAHFENIYDVNLFAFTNYLPNIKGPLQIHQGTADDAVPIDWTNEFVRILHDKNIDTEYFMYPGVDHNMNPHWNTVVLQDVEFFDRNLTEQGR